MTARTERHPAGPEDGAGGEGRTAMTGRHPAAPHDGLAGGCRKGPAGEDRP